MTNTKNRTVTCGFCFMRVSKKFLFLKPFDYLRGIMGVKALIESVGKYPGSLSYEVYVWMTM